MTDAQLVETYDSIAKHTGAVAGASVIALAIAVVALIRG